VDADDYAYVYRDAPLNLDIPGQTVALTWDNVADDHLGASFATGDVGDGTFALRITEPGWYLVNGSVAYAALNGDDEQVGGMREVIASSSGANGWYAISVLPSSQSPVLSALTFTQVTQDDIDAWDSDNPTSGASVVRLSARQVSGGALAVVGAEVMVRRLS